ncbi:hypothetical protein FB45DRAFT_108776 [Roridomyces roridus]|uniref:Uncharacterized protein n=1 Tax=Roridomyces roridus TaxID=1738132 RepID=A0AAD7FGV9_9AGAR|nr:hypothetical protein FB45DRAFT_108776 [Roridomyces roridus]
MFGLVLVSVAFAIWSTFALAVDAAAQLSLLHPTARQRQNSTRAFHGSLSCSSIPHYIHPTPSQASPNNLLPELMLYRLAMALEDRFLDDLASIHHLHEYGLQYLKIVLLAIAGHSLGLLFIFAHRHFLDVASNIRRKPFLLPALLWAFHPSLRWILWMNYYFKSRDGFVPSFQNTSEVSGAARKIVGDAQLFFATRKLRTSTSRS